MSARHRPLSASCLFVSLCALVAASMNACGSTDDLAGETPSNGADASVGGSAGAAGTAGQAGAGTGGALAGGSAGQAGEAGAAGAAGEGGVAGSAGSAAVSDPSQDGPYSYSELDATADVAATGNKVPLHVFVPDNGPASGPYPMVTIAHGFQLPASQYYSYGKRLATFGYVAVSVDFPASLVSANHLNNAKDILGAIDWALAQSSGDGNELSGKIDASLIGATGHSLGGKVSILAATLDPRIKATITLDPIDTTPPFGCDATRCPDVSATVSALKIPTGFVGETTDSAGGLQPCAPAADNFQTFFAAVPSPSLEVTVNGANHMSFLDDAASCGLVCSVCKQATLPNDQVNSLARSFVVAFYERYLRGNTGFETWLTGPDAQAKYVVPGTVTIASK